LVTDLPADFDVALQGVDTRLKALQPGTTLGDLVYSSATANTNTRLGIGSNGQVLQVSGGVPAWGAVSGGGKVLQVVMGQTTTPVTTSSGTYQNTGLTATITPSSSSSKVLVLINQNGCTKSAANANTGISIRALRGASSLGYLADGGLKTGTTLLVQSCSFGLSYLDSPATTSATVYKTEFFEGNALSSVSVQGNYETSTMILLEIGA